MRGEGIALDASGNAYVCGYTESFGAQVRDMCLVKFNDTGVEWNYTWGGSEDDMGLGIALDSSGNAYICGLTESFGAQGYDIYLVKFRVDTIETTDIPDELGLIITIFIVVSFVSVVTVVGAAYITKRKRAS